MYLRTRVLVVISLLMGCADDSARPLDDYVTRLARVLEVDGPEVGVLDSTAARQNPLPRVRELRVEFTADSVDILDFLNLGDCRLQAVVAEKNSSLGRVADASGQLRLELAFLRHGETCAAMLVQSDPELAKELRRVLENKRAQLPSRIWQATLGGEEFRRFWRSDYAATFDVETLKAIQTLAIDTSRWLQGDYTGYGNLDELLGIIGQGSGGGLLIAWDDLSRGLQRATSVVETFSTRRPLCFEGMRPQEADIFRRVVMKFFVGEIQQTAAGLNGTTYDLMPSLHQLESQLTSAEPAAYTQWRRARDAMIEAGRTAMIEHVGALEPLMVQCGFLPQMSESANDNHEN